MLPDVYRRHEAEEEKLRHRLGKDVAILRDRRGGKTRPLPMREFRERIEAGGQCDLFDWGGCGCFGEDEEGPVMTVTVNIPPLRRRDGDPGGGVFTP